MYIATLWETIHTVCTKGSNFLFAQKWITHPEVNLHYGDFVWPNSNMADRTGGQLESTVRVSNVGAKGFEPSTGWNNYIMSYTQSFQELSWGRLCKTALPAAATICRDPHFNIFQTSWTYTCTPAMGLKLGMGLQNHNIYNILSSRDTGWP